MARPKTEDITTFLRIAREQLGICEEGADRTADFATLGEAWVGMEPVWLDWSLLEFLPLSESVRVRSAIAEIDRYFRDRRRRHFEETGEARPVPHDEIQELQGRVLRCLYPTLAHVLARATGPTAERAAYEMLTRVKEKTWPGKS